MKYLCPTLMALWLASCANTPVPAEIPANPAAVPLPLIQSIAIEGPDADLQLDDALEQWAGQQSDARAIAEIESQIMMAYEWADWTVHSVVAAPEPEADGRLLVSVYAEAPPTAELPPPAMSWPPPEIVPAPVAGAGPRAERDLDTALLAWQKTASRALIDGTERRLYLKQDDGAVVSYPVAVGTAHTPTPPGAYTVEAVRRKPTWYPPPSIRRSYARKGKNLPLVVPPGPKNPLGEWFIKLQNGIGIHGTNQPRSIGRAASAGCVRMHDGDVEAVVHQLKRGDGVTVVKHRAMLLAGQPGNIP